MKICNRYRIFVLRIYEKDMELRVECYGFYIIIQDVSLIGASERHEAKAEHLAVIPGTKPLGWPITRVRRTGIIRAPRFAAGDKGQVKASLCLWQYEAGHFLRFLLLR
jgi:hypothetical protein